ncbi:MAG TPA: class I SAM-dependent DNA methyltransferase, partial [Caulobacteraceae bacterium]|nr:class I SAM-dependent DNA methyltransferase [Caulobacteraceae bacterium]
MDAVEFVRKWSDSRLRERQGSQEHFIDLCRLLGEPTPAEADKEGSHYCFERGLKKTGGGDGWADVWRKGCFGWEYKGRHKDLNAALRQLQGYALDLENPPYLVVCDMERTIVHTNWTNTVSRKYEFQLTDLYNPEKLDDLRGVFLGSDRLKPGVDRHELTAKAAAAFGALGKRLQDEGHPPRQVAHFLNRLVFCMFAEDAELLPSNLFTRTIQGLRGRPEQAQVQLANLFETMRSGGFFGADVVRWFNGGLFDDDATIELTFGDIESLAEIAADNTWSEIDPSIFGTLFEQALKATRERPVLGAHYTDREKILKIVEPVIVRPLIAEWEAAKARIAALMTEAKAIEARASELGSEARRLVEAARAASPGAADLLSGAGIDQKAVRRLRAEQGRIESQATEARTQARRELEAFQRRLAAFRVLDPACGSGNFLYVALHALRDIEQKAVLDASLIGLPAPPLQLGIEAVRGIEIEPYAAELARVTLWIGNLQWLIRRGYRDTLKEPLLSSLEQIECRDAVLNPDGTEAQWPAVDVIIGNPPFVGGKLLKRQLGIAYTAKLRAAFAGRLAGFTDFVCYWFEKARERVLVGASHRVGLVATSSIRGGTNRPVLDAIHESLDIFDAWSEEPWTIEGARVEVSLICFERPGRQGARLNGVEVSSINSDLTSGVDVTGAKRLRENRKASFLGLQLSGPLAISGDQARRFILLPTNPNSRTNTEILRPYWNGDDLTGRPRDMWLIDFPLGLDERAAAAFEPAFEYLSSARYDPDSKTDRRTLREARSTARDEGARTRWWEPYWPRPEMRRRISAMHRYLVTPETSQHRLFVWLHPPLTPDKNLIVVARDDDTSFGILQSRLHSMWALRLGTSLEDRPRYTSSTTFETFPFPEGLTPNIPAADYADDPRAQAIAAAARRLNELREAWLNPPDLVVRTPEVVAGFPDRLLPKDAAAEKALKKRTLTNLYNERPTWLDMAHRELDAAVAAAYGWPADLSDEEVLARLFALNQERAA